MSNLTIARLAVYSGLLVALVAKAWTGSNLPLLAYSCWGAGLWLMGLLVLRERENGRTKLPRGSGTRSRR